MIRLTIGNHNHRGRYCPACGYNLTSYIKPVSETNATAASVINNVVPTLIGQQFADQKQAWVSMEEAASLMGFKYGWLAHNWKSLGLHPSNFSQRRVFEVAEIKECLQRHRFSYKGRPRKR